MTVPVAQIVTLKEVYDFAVGSSKAATTKCPASAADYDSLASEIKDFVNLELQTAGGWNDMVRVTEYKQSILAINAKCIAASGSAPKIPVQPKPGGAVGPMGPPAPPLALKAGFPWWIVLVLGGGAVAYYFYTKKETSG